MQSAGTALFWLLFIIGPIAVVGFGVVVLVACVRTEREQKRQAEANRQPTMAELMEQNPELRETWERCYTAMHEDARQIEEGLAEHDKWSKEWHRERSAALARKTEERD